MTSLLLLFVPAAFATLVSDAFRAEGLPEPIALLPDEQAESYAEQWHLVGWDDEHTVAVVVERDHRLKLRVIDLRTDRILTETTRDFAGTLERHGITVAGGGVEQWRESPFTTEAGTFGLFASERRGVCVLELATEEQCGKAIYQEPRHYTSCADQIAPKVVMTHPDAPQSAILVGDFHRLRVVGGSLSRGFGQIPAETLDAPGNTTIEKPAAWSVVSTERDRLVLENTCPYVGHDMTDELYRDRLIIEQPDGRRYTRPRPYAEGVWVEVSEAPVEIGAWSGVRLDWPIWGVEANNAYCTRWEMVLPYSGLWVADFCTHSPHAERAAGEARTAAAEAIVCSLRDIEQ